MVWNSEWHSGSSPAAEGKSHCLLTVIPRGHPANLGEAGAPIIAYHISTRHLHLPCEDCQGSHDIRPSLSSTFPYPRSPISWNEWMSVKKKGIPMFSSPSMQIYLWPADTRIPSLSLLSLPDWPSLFFFLKALLQLGLTYLFLPIFVLLSPFSLIYFAFLLELVQSQGLFSVHPSHRW